MVPTLVDGDLVAQDVDAIVNAWNRNIIPWWLLLPQGVSGAIKRAGGTAPFRELARAGAMPLGAAVVTGAGRLPHQAIIHVAGIDLLWRSSELAIRRCVSSAMALARAHGFCSVAFPVIGGGTGGLGEARALSVLLDALRSEPDGVAVRVVRFRR